MDRLQLCMEELRRLANETEDLDCVILAEQAINDYLNHTAHGPAQLPAGQ